MFSIHWDMKCATRIMQNALRFFFVCFFHSYNLNETKNINIQFLSGPDHAKMCLMAYANNKGADQPAHPRSLISTFIVRCLDSMTCILAISKVSRF